VQPIWQVQSDSKEASQLKLDQPLKQHYRFWKILAGSKYGVNHHLRENLREIIVERASNNPCKRGGA
jgi:hypothetical protein